MPAAPLEPIQDHVRQALAKLIQRFRDKPLFAAWVASHVQQIQDLEDAAWQVIGSRDVDTCDETRLRLLAKLVGQPVRGTLEQLRLFVKVRILVNRSNGSHPTILKIARTLLGSIIYTPGVLAEYSVEMTEALGDRDIVYSAELLRDATLAGVGMQLIYSPAETEDSFMFCYLEADASTNPTQGFEYADGLGAGGVLAAVA
jgi:hypothetical protein